MWSADLQEPQRESGFAYTRHTVESHATIATTHKRAAFFNKRLQARPVEIAIWSKFRTLFKEGEALIYGTHRHHICRQRTSLRVGMLMGNQANERQSYREQTYDRSEE